MFGVACNLTFFVETQILHDVLGIGLLNQIACYGLDYASSYDNQ